MTEGPIDPLPEMDTATRLAIRMEVKAALKEAMQDALREVKESPEFQELMQAHQSGNLLPYVMEKTGMGGGLFG